MAKQVIATVKTDKQIIIDGVNREKLILGSASEVCERALLEYFEPEGKHEFNFTEIQDTESLPHKITHKLNVSDYWSLSQMANHYLVSSDDLANEVLKKFIRGEIRFYNAIENPVNEPITPIIEPVNQEITPIIESVSEPVNDNEEIVTIKISELLIPEVKESLQRKGFEEMRYYTTKKEQQTNQRFSKLIQELNNEHQEEKDYLQFKIDGLETNDSDVNDLIKGTKIVIEALAGSGRNPFMNYKKSDILAIFPEKLRPIFEV